MKINAPATIVHSVTISRVVKLFIKLATNCGDVLSISLIQIISTIPLALFHFQSYFLKLILFVVHLVLFIKTSIELLTSICIYSTIILLMIFHFQSCAL